MLPSSLGSTSITFTTPGTGPTSVATKPPSMIRVSTLNEVTFLLKYPTASTASSSPTRTDESSINNNHNPLAFFGSQFHHRGKRKSYPSRATRSISPPPPPPPPPP